MSQKEPTDRLDLAVSNRLSQLANRPVELTQLEQRLDSQLAEMCADPETAPRRWFLQRWHPLLNVAAVVLIMLTIGWVVFKPGSSVAVAAPANLAQIHFDVVNGLSPRFIVSDISEANQLLAEQSNGALLLPDEMPGQIMSCCLHEYAGTTLSCVLIEQAGNLITVALADGANMRSPMGETIVRNGRQFTIHQANGINMVMAQEAERWLCVMGDVSIEVLVDVAAAIKM